MPTLFDDIPIVGKRGLFDDIPIVGQSVDESYEAQLRDLGITPEQERQAKGSALRAELAFEQGDQLEKEARRQAVADYNRQQDNALSRTEAVRGVTRSTLQMGEGFSGAAETVAKLFGGPDAGETPKALGDYFAARAKAIPAAVPSLRDVEDVGSFAEYGAKALGELFPQIVTSMIPAAGAAKLGRAIGLGKKGIAALTGAGAAASSIPQEVGGMFREIRETTGQEEPLTALGFGIPAGLLDAITPGRLVGKVLGATSDEAKKLAWREVVRNAVKEIPKSAATEGLTEPIQESLAIAADKTADNSYDAVNEENFWRLLDAATMGAIGGGVFGGGITVGATALNKVSRNQEALRLKNLRRGRDDARSRLVVEPTPEVPLPPEFIALQQNIDEQQRAKAAQEAQPSAPVIPAIPKTEEAGAATATIPRLGVQGVVETTKASRGVAPVTFLEDQSHLMPGLVWYQIQEDITSPEGGVYPKGRNITSGELLRFGYTLPGRPSIGSEGTATKGGEETRQETKEVIPKQTPVVQSAAGVVSQKTERPPDILDLIEGTVNGTINLASAKTIQSDFTPTGILRKAFSSQGGQGLDVVLDTLHREGLARNITTEDELLTALQSVGPTRVAYRKAQQRERVDVKKAEQFAEDVSQAGAPVNVSNLLIGDEFEVEGHKFRVSDLEFDDNAELIAVKVQDGPRYGVRRIGADEIINVQPGSLKQTAPSTEFLPPRQTTPLPRLRQMENQGDLLATQTEPFALAQERGIDIEAQQRAQAAREQARLESEKQQLALPTTPVRAKNAQLATTDRLRIPAINKGTRETTDLSAFRIPLPTDVLLIDAQGNSASQEQVRLTYRTSGKNPGLRLYVDNRPAYEITLPAGSVTKDATGISVDPVALMDPVNWKRVSKTPERSPFTLERDTKKKPVAQQRAAEEATDEKGDLVPLALVPGSPVAQNYEYDEARVVDTHNAPPELKSPQALVAMIDADPSLVASVNSNDPSAAIAAARELIQKNAAKVGQLLDDFKAQRLAEQVIQELQDNNAMLSVSPGTRLVPTRVIASGKGAAEITALLTNPAIDPAVAANGRKLIAALPSQYTDGLTLNIVERQEQDGPKVTQSGSFSAATSIATILQNAENPDTALHEVSHWLSTFLNPVERARNNQLWRQELDRELATATGARRELLQSIKDANGLTSQEYLTQSTNDTSVYHLSNPDEFFAYRFTNQARGELKRDNAIDYVRNLLKRILEAVKRLVGRGDFYDAVWRKFMAGEFSVDARSGPLFERNKYGVAASLEPSVPTQVMGQTWNVQGKITAMTPEALQNSVSVAKSIFEQAGFKGLQFRTFTDARGRNLSIWHIPQDGFDMNAEVRQLTELIRREVATQREPGKDPYRLAMLLNTIVEEFNDPTSLLSDPQSVDTPTRIALFRVADTERSWRGGALGGLSAFKADLARLVRNVDVELNELYYDQYGGEGIESLLDRVRTIFNGEFSEEAIRDILNNQPEVEQFIDRMIAANRRDSGGRLYRKLQALLNPKAKKKLSALESDALLQEEIAKVLEIAKPLGIEPKQSPNKPLSPLQRLVLMVTPKTAAKIDGHIADAVKEGERNAGMRAALNAVSGGEAVALQEEFDAGGEPTVEMIEAGLELPEFAHWKAIRDNLLDYSPTTVKLVQDLIRGDFKGTRFGQSVARPVESKIDLNALAKSSDVEVRRVLDGYLANIEANIDITAATAETKQRVLQMIEDQTLAQLAEARQRTLDNFFNPKTSIPTTATQRLRQLLNAGVANDSRFQTDRVQQLIKRIASTYIDSDALAELAIQERDVKQAWMEATLAEISARENFGEPSEARDYLEAVTRTYLAERLQAAEERIVRAFLKGKDVEFERAPITPEQRERRLQEAKSKVEGLLRAGVIDTSMVEAVSRKSAIQKLTPSIPSLVQQILDTPSHRQADLRRNFAALLISELGIEPARADKMALVLEKAYGAKFKTARIAALAKARLALTPKEIEVIGVRKSIWKKIQDLVNAGGLDTSEIVEEIAKAHGGKFATPEEVALLRNLADKSQRLSELTPEERDAIGDDPVKLYNALEDKKALHTEEIVKIHNEMSTRWARLIQPINNPITHPIMWWDTRKHTAAAINEYLAANILLKVGVATRQTSQILTQMPIYRITRALGQAWASHRQDIAAGRPEGFWEDFGIALQDAFRTPLVVMKHSMSEAKAAFRGKAEARNVDRIMTGVMALERAALRAQEHHAKGEYAQGAMMWVLGAMRLGFRALQASDAFQGTAAEYQEISRQITNGLRSMGSNKADIELAKESILGNVQKEFPAALAYAKAAFASAGIDATDQRITRAAWNLVRSRQYQKIAELKLPADDYRAQNDYHRNVLGWNEAETRGVGGAVATFGKLAQSTLAEAGIPTGFFAFANAIGIGINRMFHFSPLYAVSSLGKGAPSPWWKTDTDAMQRRSEAIVGTMFYGILGSLALLGLIKVQLRPPEDKEERDLWQAQGHKAGTLEIPIGDGKFIPLSIASTALAYGAPYLAAGGAMNDLLAKRAKAQVALNEQAAKLGVPAGKVKPISAGEMIGVGVAAAKGAVLGSRTAAGLLYNVTDFGTPNVERFAAGQITPFVPGLPQLQELSRMGGVSLDSRMAGITDFLLPMPTSPARRVNLLGEPAETPDDLQRTLQVLSGGTYGIVDPNKANQHAAYRALFSSTYRPPSIDRNKGHAFPDSYRPMNGGELGRYTVARGKHFSRELSLLGSDPTEEQARAAYGRANADALREVGVNIARPKRGRSRSRTRSYRSRSRRFSIRSRNRFRIRGLGRRRNRRLLRV